MPQIVQPLDIGAWAERATESLQGHPASLAMGVRGLSGTLAIPLDEHANPTQSPAEAEPVALKLAQLTRPVREPMRRDSLKRREALLKGKEGSRARRRYDNGRRAGKSKGSLVDDLS